MDVQITESLRHSLTVTDSSYSLTLLSGEVGPAGPTGPNAITSLTSSDGTADIQANTLTTGTVSATGNISGSTGDFTTLTVGSNDVFSVSSAGDVATDGNITAADGDVTVSVGNITALAGNVLAPNIFASADLGYSSGGAETQETSITTGVTLNAPSGVITCQAHTFAHDDSETFTLTNSHIDVNDVVLVSFQTGHPELYATVSDVSAGSCNITIHNTHSSAGSVTPVLNFAVIKVATS